MNKFKTKIQIIFVLLFLYLIPGQAFSQTWEGDVDLNRGKLWATFEAVSGFPWGTIATGLRVHAYDYPGHNQPERKEVNHFPLVTNSDPGFFVWANVNDVPTLFRYSSTRFHRTGTGPPANYLLPLKSIQLIENYGLEDPTIPAEQIATAKVKLVMFDMDMEWRAMAWSYPKYDDFIIMEYEFTNASDNTITNFRFAPSLPIVIGSSGADEDYEWDEEHQAFYFHDGRRWDENDNPVVFNYGLTNSDLGDPADIHAPAAVTHEFTAAQYFTVYWIDKPEKSDPTEPDHMNIVDKSNRAAGGAENRNPGFESDPLEWSLEAITYDQPKPPTTEEGDPIAGGVPRTKYDRNPVYIYSTGPYSFAPGETKKFVYVVAAGMMDMEQVVAGGKENEAKLIEGKTHLWENVDAAIELYNNDYKVPNPPLTPTNGMGTLELTSLPGAVKIQWPEYPSDYVDPDYNINDFAGYRVYRSSFLQDGPWNLLADISKGSETIEGGMVTYVDQGLNPGSPYYYAVSAYDTGHDSPWPPDPSITSLPSLESGLVNANDVPVYAFWPSNNDFSEQVLVYPNPFRLNSGIPDFRWRVDFVNIPGKCKIRIYTLNADLVIEMEHDDGSGDASWIKSTTEDGRTSNINWMVTQYNQSVSPGIYFFQVENLVPGHEGEIKSGKFVIIK